MWFSETSHFMRFSGLMTKFYYSSWYIALMTAIAVFGFVMKMEIHALMAIIIIMAIGWMFVRDMTPSLLSAALLGMVPLARYGQVSYFDPMFYVLPFIFFALFWHFIVFPLKFKKGRFFYPTLAVAVAITLGGLFSISTEDYFAMPTIYYTFMLGIGMVFIYVVIECYTPKDRKDLADYLARMMLGVGIMGIMMLASGYYEAWDVVAQDGPQSPGQWRNNLSNNLLLSMPFAFYLAATRKRTVIYFTIGLIQYLALLFAFSRGGMLASTIVIPIILLSTLIIMKNERLKLVFTTLLIAILFYYVIESTMVPLEVVIGNILERIQVSENESRALMYRLAVERFLDYPIFGTGLGATTRPYYNPQPMAMFWYHSTFFQIIGSMGLLGVLAYLFQGLVRAKALWRFKSRFSLYVGLSWLGFTLYSMVNVGHFVPLPLVAMMIHMFVIVDRHNDTLVDDDALRNKERLL